MNTFINLTILREHVSGSTNRPFCIATYLTVRHNTLVGGSLGQCLVDEALESEHNLVTDVG